MNANVNLDAHLSALGLLGTGFLLLVAALVLLYLLLRGRRAAAINVALGALGLCVAYGLVLLIFSLASADKVLARGAEKHFCELDCHLAYSVADVQTTRRLGPPAHEVSAEGTFYVVTIKTRFDEQTIAPGRGDQPLTPNGRIVRVYDAQGRIFAPSPAGTRALELSTGTGMPLTTPLQPGESYTTEMVFDLPADVRNPRLLMTDDEARNRFVVGHENSPLHKKTAFALNAPDAQTAQANN